MTQDSTKRTIEVGTLVVLAIAVLLTLARVYSFSQDRFFTVDEYQYGHATWLVSEGEKPYVDFYEHHFPLSYVLHAPLLSGDASFTDKALRLRSISFAYILILAGVLGAGAFVATRSAHVGLLSAALPVGFGFSLMTLIDYRSDSFGAVAFLCCLALLEANRRVKARWLAALSGAFFAVAILMTQKMIIQGGGAIGLFWLVDRLADRGVWQRIPFATPRGGEAPRFLVRPWAFGLTAGALLSGAVLVAWWVGILAEAYEIGVVQALAHERFHRMASSILNYVGSFWSLTWPGTVAIGGLALAYLLFWRDRFWLLAVVVAGAAVANLKAQYPYNYVYLCILIGICAVRGLGWLADSLERGGGRAATLAPLVYLPAVAVLFNQLSFISDVTSNDYQLRLLKKIETYSEPGDAVIDNAGGAMFRPHGSYYYLHGEPHRTLFAEYFRTQLARDYRESRALFWIWDFRFHWLPDTVQAYLKRNYLQADGDLHALAYVTPATRGVPHRRVIDVIREDDYYVHRFETDPDGDQQVGLAGLFIDGKPVTSDRIHLEERRYAVRVEPNSAAYILSPLPREFFEERTLPDSVGRYTRIFEYGE